MPISSDNASYHDALRLVLLPSRPGAYLRQPVARHVCKILRACRRRGMIVCLSIFQNLISSVQSTAVN